MTDPLPAPFPWFGGKRRVADLVWDALGDVDNYVEPFFGSGAVLLARPAEHTGRVETVNDLDCYLSNFWRALTAAPEEVAQWASWPVNECDLLARHIWLVNHGKERIEAMEADPDFYDAKVAGWWVWGINSWIGSGWCAGGGPWQVVDGKMVLAKGQGVNRQLPHLGNREPGPELPRVWTGDRSLLDYCLALAARLRKVRVCCGDWQRVVTEGAMAYGDAVGVFLDPPYLGDVRAKDIYRVDDHSISISVRDWALAHGDDPRLRIILAGYAPEHESAMPATWRVHAYSASNSYGTAASVGKGQGNEVNRHLERLWFSPHCQRPEQDQSLMPFV